MELTEWTSKEDEKLIKSCLDNTVERAFPNRSSSNIYVRKLVLAQNMVEKDHKKIEDVCNFFKVANEDLMKKLNENIKKTSKKGTKQIKKISEESHANLLYSYTELKEQLDRIEEKLNTILDFQRNQSPS